MAVDKKILNREAIAMELENAVLRYKRYTMVPAIEKLLKQCVCIELVLTIEDSNALAIFQDLSQDIMALLNAQNQEGNE